MPTLKGVPLIGADKPIKQRRSNNMKVIIKIKKMNKRFYYVWIAGCTKVRFYVTDFDRNDEEIIFWFNESYLGAVNLNDNTTVIEID